MSSPSPPPSLPTTTILELSQKDAHVVKKNGDYTVQFTEPVTLQAGDQLNLKMVAIDSQDADSESIVLPLNGATDQTNKGTGSTTVSFGFSFYDMNYDLTTGYTSDAVNRKQFVLGETGAGTVYAPDCQPYQPYGNISTQTLNDVTMTFTKTYKNGHTKDQARLDGFLINVGFTWYEPQADGTALFKQSDLRNGQYMFTNRTSYTDKKKSDRPTEIKTGTTAKCTLYGGPPIVFKKGTLQIASVALTVDMTDDAVLPAIIGNGFEYLNYSAQSSRSNNPVIKVINNGMDLVNTQTAVQITTATPHGLVVDDIVQLAGVAGTTSLNGIPISQLNDTHKVTSITSPTVFVFQVPTAATSDGTGVGGADMDIEAAGPVQLITATQSIQIPHGRYDRNSLAAFITKAFSEVTIGNQADPFQGGNTFAPDTTLQFRTSDSTFGSIRFRKMEQYSAPNDEILFDANNSYTYDRAGGGAAGTTPINMLIGASKFSMTYGNNGNIYQWDNGHTAVCNPVNLFPTGANAVPTPSTTVGFYQIGSNFHQVNSASGIIVHDMEPKQLWDDILGLYNNCTVPIETGIDDQGRSIQYVAYANMIDHVPTESSQINAFTLLNNRQPIASKGLPTAAAPLYADTASIPTNAVLGETPIVIGAGFYLVEILSLNLAQSNVIDNQENRGNISAIVYTQYNANDSITGFADSGIPYVHRGTPAMISSANVRILDPDTKDVPNNLGNRNTVFLQVNGTAPIFTPAKVAPDKNAPTQQQVRGGS
jgi:hypothetical protein